ncbi:hypothetical protein [Euzebya pacifica]|uniref:hypothetical protein n=1 Tax=Euzebya pacifica TaxID=1608957 RepID=UPI000DF836E6|nr:hypothetical protein [Euzebya pacifica]
MDQGVLQDLDVVVVDLSTPIEGVVQRQRHQRECSDDTDEGADVVDAASHDRADADDKTEPQNQQVVGRGHQRTVGSHPALDRAGTQQRLGGDVEQREERAGEGEGEPRARGEGIRGCGRRAEDGHGHSRGEGTAGGLGDVAHRPVGPQHERGHRNR